MTVESALASNARSVGSASRPVAFDQFGVETLGVAVGVAGACAVAGVLSAQLRDVGPWGSVLLVAVLVGGARRFDDFGGCVIVLGGQDRSCLGGVDRFGVRLRISNGVG
jgi:hypothetical protein